MNLGFYLLIFQLTPRSARRRLGQVSSSSSSWPPRCSSTAWSGFLHAQRRRVQRTDPHRRPRFRPAQADRHAVLISLHKDRLVGAVELLLRRRPAGLFAGATGLPRPALVADRALSAVHRLRRGDHVQPDDRAGGHQRLAGPQPDAVRFLVLHHQLLALPDGDLLAARSARRCSASSRSSFRCWWSSTCRRG